MQDVSVSTVGRKSVLVSREIIHNMHDLYNLPIYFHNIISLDNYTIHA